MSVSKSKSDPQDQPAFPLGILEEGSDSSYTGDYWKGISTRDFFAAAALIGIVTGESNVNYSAGEGWTDKELNEFAGDAYRIADEMIKVRATK